MNYPMHLYPSTLIFISFAFTTNGQTVTGMVTDQNTNPVVWANVVLQSDADSAVIQWTVTDEFGNYEFEEVGEGSYLLKVTSVGYGSGQSTSFYIRQGDVRKLPVIVLEKGVTLDEVKITANKLPFELKSDRVVMNVGAFPSASGSNGLELLQKVPGLIVNMQNNSLSMTAKGDVMVMINNKIQRLPASVLMAKLQGIRAENVEQIEIIHQPPSRYDTGGAAGIIHIVLRKNEEEGTNGNLALMAGYGQREKAGVNLNLNSRKGILNAYGNYSYNRHRANDYELNHNREYEHEGNFYYFENTAIDRNYQIDQHSANIGLDLDLNKNTVVGILLGGSLSGLAWAKNGESNSSTYVNNEKTGDNKFFFTSLTDTKSLTSNINVFQKINAQSNLNLNLDYAKIQFGNSGNLINRNIPDHMITYDRATPVEFRIGSLDYVNQLENWTMETGIKGTFNNTINNTIIRSRNDEFWEDSGLFHDKELIREKLLAAYLSFKGGLTEKLDMELGLRYEHYDYILERSGEKDIEILISKPFPVLRLNYKIDSLNTLQFGFNRTVTRPSFFNLTSFFVLFDPSLILYANPLLKPSFTNTFKISYQRKKVLLSLFYLNRTNSIYFYNTVDKEKYLQICIPNNLDHEHVFQAEMSFSFMPTRWWEVSGNLYAYYHKVKDASERPLPFEADIFTFSTQLNSTISFKNNWSANIDGIIRSPLLLGDQRQFLFPFFNLGVRKEFSSGATLGIAFLDLTNSSEKIKWEYHQPELGIRTFGNNDFSERQIRATFTYLFGNQSLTGKRQRKTGADDVKSRM